MRCIKINKHTEVQVGIGFEQKITVFEFSFLCSGLEINLRFSNSNIIRH